MDPTTLVTFIFRAPPDARTVELLGSWDNFQLPYRMHNDRRRGAGSWSGCFKFDNIIFDGTALQWARPRSGGLKQGGTYWYYYRLNYQTEAFDSAQPCTTHCPLLPGQPVNILEVPTEIVDLPSRCHSAAGDIAGSLSAFAKLQTMDPSSKFAVLSPPPKSRVHKYCLSDDALNGRLEHDRPPAVGNPLSGSVPVDETSQPAAEWDAHGHDHRRSVLYSSSSIAEQDAVQSVLEEYEPQTSPTQHGFEWEFDAADGADQGEEDCLTTDPFQAPRERRRASEVSWYNESDPMPTEEHTAAAPPLTPESKKINPARTRSPCLVTSLSPRSDRSIGPASVQNVQFYGSRPGTCDVDSPGQYRPRIHSVTNTDLREYIIDGSYVLSPTSPSSHHFSTHDPEEEELGPTSDNDMDAFDLMSPTFSAATLSTGGENSPFRLSATSDDGHEAAMDNVAVRLRSLDAHDDSPLSPEPTSPHVADRRGGYHPHQHQREQEPRQRQRQHDISLSPTPSFVNYSLPAHLTESSLSLAKTISFPTTAPRTATLAPPLPSFAHDNRGSVTADIFDELGYLGGSIA